MKATTGLILLFRLLSELGARRVDRPATSFTSVCSDSNGRTLGLWKHTQISRRTKVNEDMGIRQGLP